MIDSKFSQPGLLIIVSGPAGSGKTTLCERILAKEPALSRVVTATTRKPRAGEKNNVDYYFFDPADFEKKIKAGDFYEYAKVHSNLYGTLKTKVQEKLTAGFDLLLNIDIQGAATFREKAKTDPSLRKSLVTIFIMPPSLKELEKRLRERAADPEDEIQRRMQVAIEEMKQCTLYDYCLRSATRNEDFENLYAIYRAEKMRNR